MISSSSRGSSVVDSLWKCKFSASQSTSIFDHARCALRRGRLLVCVYLLLFFFGNFNHDVGEVIDFLGQVFEGIHFMHQHRVAHRDCHAPNIMMNADAMYPGGFHPVAQNKGPNWKGRAKHFSARNDQILHH